MYFWLWRTLYCTVTSSAWSPTPRDDNGPAECEELEEEEEEEKEQEEEEEEKKEEEEAVYFCMWRTLTVKRLIADASR